MSVWAHLVLLVLPGVGEAGDDGGDPGRGGDLTGVDHDQQLHQVVVDFAAAALHDVHVLASHALTDLHAVGEREESMRWLCEMFIIYIIHIRTPPPSPFNEYNKKP